MIDKKIIIEETITDTKRQFYETLNEIRLTEREREDLGFSFDRLFEIIEEEIIEKQ